MRLDRETARGCLHKCTFCPTQIWNKRIYRTRPMDLVIEEVHEIVGRYGMREINIRDDTFTLDRDRVVEFCDGWMPISGRPSQGPSLAEKIAMLRRQAEEAGRDPASINVTTFGARPNADAISGLDAAGVNRYIFMLPSAERDTVVPIIDECAKLI